MIGRSPRATALAACCALAMSAALDATASAAGPADPRHPELSDRLVALKDQPAATAQVQGGALGLAPEGPGSLLRRGGKPVVEVRFSGKPAATADALRALGAEVLHVSARYETITAAVDPARLDDIAEIQGVESISEVLTPLTSAVGCPSGPTVSEGVDHLKAAQARQAFRVDGSGVMVGVLSDSYDQDGSAETHESGDRKSGDLPGKGNPCGHTSPVAVGDEYPGSDEGRAMAQIVHDVAPGSRIAFASAFSGALAFADNIRALENGGAQVIVDDVTYPDEPFFQDGPIAAAVNDVTAAGVTYFSSAGNNNVIATGGDVASWEAPAFRSSEAACQVDDPDATDCMDFDPGVGIDNTYAISVEQGATVFLDLQWAQPWYGVTTDLDAYLTDAAGDVLDRSENANTSTQKPFEAVAWTNDTGIGQTINLSISRFAGAGGGDGQSPRLKFIFLGNGAEGVVPTEYTTSEDGDVVGPAIFGHNGAENAVSTAAVRFSTTTEPEEFSSRGPLTLHFQPVFGVTPAPALGGPQILAKPDLAATDCNRTSFFVPPDNRFCGTSASAPHAAGVAALALEVDPDATVSAIKDALRTTARPVGSFGLDAVGSGLVDALAALDSLGDPPPDGPPKVTISSPADGEEYAFRSTLLAAFSCRDMSGAGLASCKATESNGSKLDTSKVAERTFTVVATDKTGASTTVTSHYKVVKRAIAPTVTLVRPADGDTYRLKTTVFAQFSCADRSGSGLASCKGTKSDGSRLSTGKLGAYTFRVVAKDKAGNTKTVEHAYEVTSG